MRPRRSISGSAERFDGGADVVGVALRGGAFVVGERLHSGGMSWHAHDQREIPDSGSRSLGSLATGDRAPHDLSGLRHPVTVSITSDGPGATRTGGGVMPGTVAKL